MFWIGLAIGLFAGGGIVIAVLAPHVFVYPVEHDASDRSFRHALRHARPRLDTYKRGNSKTVYIQKIPAHAGGLIEIKE